MTNLALPIWLIITFLIGYLFHAAQALFIWIISSILLFAILDTWHTQLKKKGVSNLLSATLLVVSASFICGIIIALIVHFSSNVFTELEYSKNVFLDYYKSMLNWFKDFTGGINSSTVGEPITNVQTGDSVQQVQVVESSPISAGMGNTLLVGVSNVMSVLAYIFLWPILTFFLLAEKDQTSVVFKKILPPGAASAMWKKIVEATKAFFLGNLILFLVTLPLFAITFKLFSIENYFTLSALAGVINIIPFVGAVLTGVLPALQVLGQTQNPAAALWLYIICLVIHFILANFVTPKVLGSKVNLNATTSTIVLMVWSMIWGAMGLVLAIPVTAALRIVFEHSGNTTLVWISDLMSESEDYMPKPKIKKKEGGKV